MFDPTIFDNLKVVLEGELYDREREGLLVIRSRQDLLDLASFSRAFRMKFSLPEFTGTTLELILASDLQDFASELKKLHSAGPVPGCLVQISYNIPGLYLDESLVQTLQSKILDWWEQAVDLECMTETSYSCSSGESRNNHFDKHISSEILLTFKQKINEQHMGDLPQLVDHLLQTSGQLQKLIRESL